MLAAKAKLYAVVPLGLCACVEVLNLGERDGGPAPSVQDSSAPADGSIPDAGLSDAVTDPADGQPTKLYAFVTNRQLLGDFAAGADAGPFLVADAICAEEAAGAGLKGTFRAWLSYSNAGTPYNANARIADGPYYLPGKFSVRPDVLLVDSKATLLSKDGGVSLVPDGQGLTYWRSPSGDDVTEDENTLVAWAWTGTRGDGTLSNQGTCNNWTDTGDIGVAGNARRRQRTIEAEEWTYLGGRPCNIKRRLYCFQVTP
jgi:hypothetical protein